MVSVYALRSEAQYQQINLNRGLVWFHFYFNGNLHKLTDCAVGKSLIKEAVLSCQGNIPLVSKFALGQEQLPTRFSL